jgi:hypothetical protein
MSIWSLSRNGQGSGQNSMADALLRSRSDQIHAFTLYVRVQQPTKRGPLALKYSRFAGDVERWADCTGADYVRSFLV